MAKYLYKLGLWSVKNRKKVFLGAIGLFIALSIIAISMGPSFSGGMTIPGTESTKAGKLLEKEFPATKNTGATVQLVMKAPKDKTLESEDVNKVITETLNEIKKDKAVTSVATPLQLHNLSADKRIGYADVNFKVSADNVTQSSKDKILDKIKITRHAGIQTEIGGNVTFTKIDTGEKTEGIGILVAFMVLAITFTSFLAAGLPIITVILGLAIGIMGILIGTKYFSIASMDLSLCGMLGLAVGIDYALFIISRFRQEVSKGNAINESVAIATGTAGSAVVFAGMTVVIALLGLSVTNVPFLTSMGTSAALCVFMAILVAIMVVPAMLGMMGEKISPFRKNKFLQKITRVNKKQASSNKWGIVVTKRPFLVTILGVVLLAIIGIPFFHMELGLPNDGTKSKQVTERRAYDLQTEAYGPGFHATLVVVAKNNNPLTDAKNSIEKATEDIKNLSNVKSVSPPIPSPSGKVYMISVTPKTGPDDIKTKDLVNEIRAKSKVMQKEQHIQLFVTGTTAVNIDISQKLNDALPRFALLIVGFAYLLLLLVFRSILVPLKAVLGFLLSVVATLGFVVYVIQDGHLMNVFGLPTTSPVLNFLPVLVVGILFGLAMDYEVFLVSRMREEYTHTGNAKKSILAGMNASGNVVTAAGLIMMAVFSGFVFAADPIVKSMGLALTFGVFFDAFVVRLTIVPAVMTLMGKSAWYLPKWLDKILPNIDIEGETIMKHIDNKSNKSLTRMSVEKS
ncbi:MMPL family transporter [Bacillus sp. CGMCC 1.60114]|uniref:MMPL family transporter n=1 Tax=unclassified Bacillus (in: firmicutes) TaxID=185979 RepID=UPI0036449EA1